MNEQNGLESQNIFGNEAVLNQGLVDATVQENADLNRIQSDGAYTDPLSSEAIELTPTESSLSDPGLELFSFGTTPIFNLASASASTAVSDSDNYAVFAEDKLVIKGNSDFDGDPFNPSDDAYIYAGDGFDIKSISTFPVLRNDAGEPIEDESGKEQLVEGAVVVGDGYSKAEAKANAQNLSGLIPPSVVPATTLEVPAYADTVNDELTRRIAPDTEPIIFNAKRNKIKNATDWYNLFPTGGTEENLTNVRVVGGKLDIPNNVDLSHYNIIVERGDVKFKGSNNKLDNVLLFAESGKLEAKRLVANDVSLLASDKIDIKSDSQFTGSNLIANGKGKIEFKSTVTTPNETDSLRIISAEDVELKSPSLVRGQLLAIDDLNIKGDSIFYGLLGAGDDINFDGEVEVYAIPDEPEATIHSLRLTEADSGTVARLTVSLLNESNRVVSVDYATVDGTAISGTDYQAKSGTLTFEPGEMTSAIEVPIVGDNVYEADEAFTVKLTNPDGITLQSDTATIEILNDDPLPDLALANVEVVEDNGTAQFTLSLSNPSSRTVTLDYATVDGSAVAGSDYQTSFGTITFEPGETSQTIEVELIDDSIYELTEAFTIEFSNPTGATLPEANESVTATIIENDELPALSINSVVATEGVDSSADFVVTLDQPAAVSVTVEYLLTYSSVDSSGVGTSSGTITFEPGEISRTVVSIPVVEDNIDRLDQNYLVELSNPVNASIVTGQGTATITDNDPTPQLSVADYFINEGNDGTSEVVYTVALDNPSDREITVDYFTADGTATADVDYLAGSGTITFAPGETSKTVTIAVTGDNLDEVNETFWLNLDNATNAVISELQGTLTIVDDDDAPVAAVNEVSIIEDGIESSLAAFTVSLNNPSGKEITLDYTTVDGTAVAEVDYIANSGTITFAPGETTKTIEVEIIADTLDEINEAFGLELTNPNNVTLGTTETTATITDNDEPPIIAIDSVTLTEGDESTGNAVFTLSLDSPSSKEITVDYATVDGTAISGEDYTANNGTITFEPGETTKTIEVVVTGDRVFEGDEAFTVELSNPSFATISEEARNGTAKIIDNELPPVTLNLNLVSDTGEESNDNISLDVAITGTIENFQENISLNASFEGTDNSDSVDISNLIQPDGSFVLDVEQLQQINSSFGDGTHVLQLTAIDNQTGSTGRSEITFTLDSVLNPALFDNPTTAINYIDLDYGESVTEQALNLANYDLTIENGDDSSLTVEIDSIQQLSDSKYRLHLAEYFKVGDYNLDITSQIKDLAGNSANNAISWSIFNSEPIEISPSDGEAMVNHTRETVVRFKQKIDPSTINSESFYLIANGEKVAGRIKVSSTNEFATFFYDESLPPSTEVRIIVEGDKILDPSGKAIDVDGDGNLGGTMTADFTTLPLTRIENTDVFGYVYDSYNTNPDGSNIPIVGATIRLDALPDVFAVTDENGYFRLEDVPAPDFAVHIDGSTAINAPEDSTYATVGKLFHSQPGQEVQLTMDGEAFDVYLPPMATDDIQQLSTTEATNVGFGESGKEQLRSLFPDIDSELWNLVKVTFPEGSAQDEEGNIATQATIIPVAPDRLPAPLPPYIDPKLVISIQAGGESGFSQSGGATNFDVPAPIQFPNLEGLAPGEKSLVWSFDHDAGDWVVVGTGTVSEDGLTIASDPGVGILAPGWHFVQSGTGAAPETPCVDNDCIQISGQRGDIIKVDLKQALPAGATAQNWEINIEGGGKVLQDGDSIVSENGQTFEESGVFYFIPTIDTRPQVGGTLQLDGLLIDSSGPDAATATFSAELNDPNNPGETTNPTGVLEIDIEDGYSPIQLTSAVGSGGNPLDVARVQQRLRFFNYPDYGSPDGPSDFVPAIADPASAYPPGILIETDGETGLSTSQAIRLFQAAITEGGSPRGSSDGVVDPGGNTLQWLNASNAPRWVELIDPVLGGNFDISRCNTPTTFSPCTGQWERFGTHWVARDIQLATGQISGTQLVTGISEYGHTDLHSTHKGGNDIDLAYGGASGEENKFASVDFSLNTSSPTGDLRQYYLSQLETGIAQESDPNRKAGLELVLQTVEEILAFYDSIGADRWKLVYIGQNDTDRGYKLVREVLQAIDPNIDPRSFSGHADHYHISTKPPALNVSFTQSANLLSQSDGEFSTARGFGSSNRLYYRFELDNGFDLVGQSEEIGDFTEVLPPNTDYTLTVYQPSTNTSGVYTGKSNQSGNITDLGVLFRPDFGGLDTDGDRIPDVGEKVIGTSIDNTDTDNDGIDDAAELEQGLDPLGGQNYPTGIIASLPVRGEAKAVIVEGSNLESTGQTAYVATGSYGLAIVDASQFSNPIVQGQLELSGDATDVGVDNNLEIAAVATNSGGLQLVDVSDLMLPVLNRTIDLNATKVEVIEGVAYATVGASIRAIDLLTGKEIQNLKLPGYGEVTGMAREGNLLYAFVSGSDTFSVIDISEMGRAEVLGQLDNANVASRDVGVFAANGVAYLAGSGIRTIDISNPNNPTFIADPNLFFTARNMALNGSGLALVAAENQGIGVYDISDPQNTNNFLAQIDTPGFAYDVAIASGISFVADRNGELQVINYLPFDNQGQAPSVKIDTDVIDADPNLEGIQVFEGSNITLSSELTDDRQIRNVETLINGEVVGNDVSFPFDSNIFVPQITPETDIMEVQLRATDTGGNTSLSDVLELQIIPDTIAPEINSIKPIFGSTVGLGQQTVEIIFSEPIDTETVNINTITVSDSKGNIVVPSNIQTRSSDRFVQLTLPDLAEEDYELRIDASTITDRVGNALGTENIISTFKVTSANIGVSANVADIDSNMPGIQVEKGTNINLEANIFNNEISFKDLEFIVNGEVLGNDSFSPYTFSFPAPEITPEFDALTIQVRGVDNNNLISLSEPLEIDLVDYTPPAIISFKPSDVSSATSGRKNITIEFSESIAPGTLNEETIQLFDESGNILTPLGIQQLDNGKAVQLDLAPLESGSYTLELKSEQITDLAGNLLGTEDLIHSFTLEPINVSLGSDDFDPEVEGIQIPEGSTTVPINVDISSPGDTQVEKLELFVNGELIESDDTAPFKISPLDLSLLELDSDSITVEASVVDSNGTIFTSEPQIFSLVPDTFGPKISYTNVDRYGFYGMRNIQITFNEPLSVDSADLSNFQLFRRGDFVEPLGIELNDNQQLVKLNYNGLYPGTHELIINSPAITDELGNVMGTEPLTKSFTVYFID